MSGGFAVHDLVVELPGLAPAAQRRVLDRVFAQVVPQLQILAVRWCRSGGDVRLAYHEDIVQEAAEELVIALQSFAAGTAHRNVGDWNSYLYRIAERKALRWFISSAATPLSGRTAIERRARGIRRGIVTLHRELGREPTAGEVAQAHNAEMRARRSNVGKQGVLVTEAEVRTYLR